MARLRSLAYEHIAGQQLYKFREVSYGGRNVGGQRSTFMHRPTFVCELSEIPMMGGANAGKLKSAEELRTLNYAIAPDGELQVSPVASSAVTQVYGLPTISLHALSSTSLPLLHSALVQQFRTYKCCA